MADSNAQQPPGQSTTSYDVIVIGAGISGINTAYRLQSLVPDLTYTILEERFSLGGTWDLFKYPGIRSDSDLHTFGFEWRPWPEKLAIADAASIKRYITESAALYKIDEKIQYGKKLVAANWSSDLQFWQLSIDTAKGSKEELQSRFLVMGTGYYDYHNALSTTIPGLENFKGQVVHPQFWPETLNYANKKIVIIGSGATAVTLLPALAKSASHVTMLQRSPSYVLAQPTSDAFENFAQKSLPVVWARQVLRWKFMVVPYLFYLFCRQWPAAGRWFLRNEATARLPASIPHDPHFKPRYNPLEQRLCISPDGDFFSALKSGNSIVTGEIKTMTENGIVVESEGGNGSAAVEQTIADVDIIITATGLKVHLAGGALISVDQTPVIPSEKYAWNTAMLEDLPNLILMIGYTFGSWTLGADASAILFCRILKECAKSGATSVTPRLTERERKTLGNMKLLDLESTYLNKALAELPMAGTRGPWRARRNYFEDWTYAQCGSVRKGLVYESVKPERV